MPTDVRPLIRLGCAYCAIFGAMGLLSGMFAGPAVLLGGLCHLAMAVLLWRFAR